MPCSAPSTAGNPTRRCWTHRRPTREWRIRLVSPDASIQRAGLRAEAKKAFRHDIPLSERDDWEARVAGRRAAHQGLTAADAALETELNGRVYALFGLTREEIAVVEESTKQPLRRRVRAGNPALPAGRTAVLGGHACLPNRVLV